MNQRRNHSFRSIHPLRKPLNFDARKIHSFHVDSFLNQSDCNRMVSNPTANRHRGFIYSRARVVNPGWVFIVIYREAGSTRRISNSPRYTRETRLFSLHCCITSGKGLTRQAKRGRSSSATLSICMFNFVLWRQPRQTRRNGHCSRERDDSIVHVNVLISRWSWGACFFSRRSRKIELINFNSYLYLKEEVTRVDWMQLYCTYLLM